MIDVKFDIPRALRKQFISLLNRLSPENVACDGELPPEAIREKYAKLMMQWHVLEEEAGRPVDESEVFGWFLDDD